MKNKEKRNMFFLFFFWKLVKEGKGENLSESAPCCCVLTSAAPPLLNSLLFIFNKYTTTMSAAMSGRESLQSQLEHLQMKYVGTGHADTTK
jgi:Splicing factor 3B subunit 10 (SF3b10)